MSSDVMTECPNCAEPVLLDDRFCETCGTQLLDDDTVDDRDHREIEVGTAAGVTDRGRVHRRNEDALSLQCVADTVIAVVCDGVSSSVAADSASRVAADVAGRVLASALSSPLGDPNAAMLTAIGAANDAVTRVPWRRTRSLAAPSCTFVAAVWDGRRATVCSIGDSRAYWVGASSSRGLTTDDSWAQEQVDAGLMTMQDAETDAQAHAITRWLGADAPDEPYQVETFVPGEPGRLVVCSDGLWNYAPSASAIADLVDRNPDAQSIEVARALVDFALAAGGHDNITVAVVDVIPHPDTTTTGENP